MTAPPPAEVGLANGQNCIVLAGSHKGKRGVVEDLHVSKGGNVTITVRQADGVRFKTLARSVQVVNS